MVSTEPYVPAEIDVRTIEESLTEQRLKGKRIIITGTSRGTGAVAQELLAAHGAYVCGVGRTPGGAEKVAAAIREKGYKAKGFDYDLADYDQAKAWVDACAEEMGGIDVVINNGSKPECVAFADMTPELWKKSHDNELTNVYNVCYAAWPYLLESAPGGSIVNVSSGNGTFGVGGGGMAAHCSAKAAVIGLTKQLAMEAGAYGIRANVVSPGAIASFQTMDTFKPDPTDPTFIYMNYMMQSTVIKQPLNMLDVAYAYLFFASDESRFITGVDLPVDGGFSAGLPGPFGPGESMCASTEK